MVACKVFDGKDISDEEESENEENWIDAFFLGLGNTVTYRDGNYFQITACIIAIKSTGLVELIEFAYIKMCGDEFGIQQG